MNLRKKPVQHYTILCFLLLLLTFTPTLCLAADCNVEDPGFEAGIPNIYWRYHSDNFVTPITELNPLHPEWGVPHWGYWWAFFGGYQYEESGYVEQDVEIPAENAAVLDFYLAIPYSDNDGYLRVTLDGNELFEATEADADSYATYQKVSLDLSTYADGVSHVLRFESTTYANDGTGEYKVTDFWVDDICITVTTANGDTIAMPWIPLLLLDE